MDVLETKIDVLLALVMFVVGAVLVVVTGVAGAEKSALVMLCLTLARLRYGNTEVTIVCNS